MIRKRNLDPSLVSWIMNNSGLGPGIGDIKYLVPATSSTSQYRSWLQSMGVSDGDLFTTIAGAYGAIVANRNDVILAMPGEYTVTEELTWAKSRTALMGLAGPNVAFQPTTLTTGGLRFTCNTAAVGSIFDFTGDFVNLYGIGTQNTVSNAGNLGDIKISARNFYAKACDFRGGQGANQVNAAAGAPIWIPAVAGAGNAAKLVECKIGSSGNATRTAGAGCIYSVGGAAETFSMELQKCILSMRAESVTPSAIILAGAYSADRYFLLDDCFCYNFSENHGTQPAYVITDSCATTHDICLKNSMMKGFTAWCSSVTHCFTNLANAESEGGRAIAVAVT